MRIIHMITPKPSRPTNKHKNTVADTEMTLKIKYLSRNDNNKNQGARSHLFKLALFA